MAIVVTEEFGSREQRDGVNPNAELRYLVSGTNDEAEAKAAVKAQLTTYLGLWPNEVSLEQMDAYNGGFKVFRSIVTYGPTPGGIGVGDDEDIPVTWSMEFATESVKIQQAIAVVNTYHDDAVRGLEPDNFNGAINVTDEGVEGVEVQVPVCSLSASWSIPTTSWNPAYRVTLARLVGSINNSTWYGFSPREVRFDGASITGTLGERTSLTWRFSVSPNAYGLQIGRITDITKAGWDYLWCKYSSDESAAAKLLIPRPYMVNVVQVYPLANFLSIGIGG